MTEPTKRELVEALNNAQTTLKKQTAEIIELRQRVAIAEAVSEARSATRIKSDLLDSAEYNELRGLMQQVLTKLGGPAKAQP